MPNQLSNQPPYNRENHPRRRQSDVDADFDRREAATIHERMDRLEEKLDANTRITEENAKVTAENTKATTANAELFEGLSAGIKVIGFIGAFFKWVLPVAAGAAWIYSFVTTGHPPTKP